MSRPHPEGVKSRFQQAANMMQKMQMPNFTYTKERLKTYVGCHMQISTGEVTFGQIYSSGSFVSKLFSSITTAPAYSEELLLAMCNLSEIVEDVWRSGGRSDRLSETLSEQSWEKFIKEIS